jgi:hypothetical protein
MQRSSPFQIDTTPPTTENGTFVYPNIGDASKNKETEP